MSLPAGVMDDLEQIIHDTSLVTALVNITRSCKYSQVLLIMGENIARNM
jgi:hypothetical protein